MIEDKFIINIWGSGCFPDILFKAFICSSLMIVSSIGSLGNITFIISGAGKVERGNQESK